MHLKSKLLILFVLTLVSSIALAQRKRVIIRQEGVDSDSLSEQIIFDRDIDINMIRDSIKNHFIWSHEGNIEILGDSSLQKVFIHKVPSHERKAARIVIKKSGFFKKNKIIIDFDPVTRSIIQVIDNNEEIPSKKFHKYQDYLEDATELPELEALHPRMEELEFKLQSMELPDSEKIAELKGLLVELKDMGSERALFKKEHYSSLKKIIELENLEEIIQDILESAGVAPPQKLESIAIIKGKFFVNGVEVKGATGEKCIQAYVEHSDLEPEDFKKRGDEISIEISFD